ncbi:hypothetical protein DV738_g5079, partial [Chaetothyriales sp. CBS 135597]
METTSHRPWETTSQHVQHQTQTLPSISTLTSKLPLPPERGASDLTTNPPQRDSGSWMSNTAPASTPSTNTMPFLNSAHSPTGPAASPFSPVPDSNTPGPTPAHQPNGTSTDPHLHRGSGDFDDARRGSVAGSTASNLHQGMNALGLGPTSPYHSNNHSQSSIVSGLQQQRGIQPNGFGAGRYGNMNGPMSPYGSLRSSRGFTAGRVAPPILGIPKSEVYSADNPTRGQAYAFPDPDAPGRPPATGRPPSHVSRRNSFAESFTSSILTVESTRLPPGQQELPDSHHHSLMNKQIDSLRGDPDSPNGATPYSRTPELRVTHKLAERKRRSEMKDCFEQLRQRLPASQNNKSSKWETLSRAIDYISSLESQLKQSKTDADKQRHQLEEMRIQMQKMSEQMQRLQQTPYPPPPNGIPQSPLNHGSYYQNGIDGSSDSARTLPPLMNGAMQGVQY